MDEKAKGQRKWRICWPPDVVCVIRECKHCETQPKRWRPEIYDFISHNGLLPAYMNRQSGVS